MLASAHVANAATNSAVLLQIFSTYRFTFDHVYAHDAAQADVYMNSARESVLNALQVCVTSLHLSLTTSF